MKSLLLRNLFLGFAILMLSYSCKDNATETTIPTMDGVWESVGYGRIVTVEDGAYLMAETTSISCIPLMEGDISEFGDALQLKNDTLSLVDGINTYLFTRVNALPGICTIGSAEQISAGKKATDPEYNFEVLWETFKEHYAYFELRKVDPEAMYAKYRPQVTATTTPAELYFIMYQMLDEFDDGHIGLDAPEEVMEAAEAMWDQLKAQNQAEEETTETPKKRLRNYQVAKEVALKYIPQGTFIKNGHLRWGSLEGNIGYLQVNQMMFVADVELSDTLSYRDYIMGYFELIENEGIDTPEEVAGLNNSLDIIMKDLGNSNALIIDLRFNGGGKDEVGMAILDRLNDTEREAFTKKGKLGNGFTPTNHVKQGATENAFTKPVYLLIATESASATEIMTLSSLSMPHVTRVGSRTEGVFSDILDRVLPNGWEFGLSSEVYLDNNGNNYEGVGIPPDVEIGYARDTQKFLHKVMDDLNSTGDAAVEKALELIRN